MSRTVKLILLLVFGVQFVWAQGMFQRSQGPKKPSIDQRVQHLSAAVNLTAEQQKAVRKIFEKADARMKEIFEQNRGNRRAMRAAALDQREKTTAQIMNLLNDVQKEKYKNYLKLYRPKSNSRQMGPRQGQRRRMRF